MKKIAIYVPAYNTAHTIPMLLDGIPADIRDKVQEIFIVDNASTDTTYLTVIGYRHETGMNNLRIIRNERNMGYGGSQKIAYKYVIEQGYDIVVMLHGDAQYSQKCLPELLAPVEAGEADLIFGSRIKGDPLAGGMPLYRYVFNRILTWIENTVLGTNLSEFHSGYRIYDVKALNAVPFEKCADDYHFDTDILVQFSIAGLRIGERPIPTHYGKESSSPSFYQCVVYGLNILYSMFEYWLHKKGFKRIEKFDICPVRRDSVGRSEAR